MPKSAPFWGPRETGWYGYQSRAIDNSNNILKKYDEHRSRFRDIGCQSSRFCLCEFSFIFISSFVCLGRRCKLCRWRQRLYFLKDVSYSAIQGDWKTYKFKFYKCWTNFFTSCLANIPTKKTLTYRVIQKNIIFLRKKSCPFF